MLGVKLVDWIILCASTAGKSAYMYIEKWVIDKNWERAANFFSRKRERRVSEYARVAGRSSRRLRHIQRCVRREKRAKSFLVDATPAGCITPSARVGDPAASAPKISARFNEKVAERHRVHRCGGGCVWCGLHRARSLNEQAALSAQVDLGSVVQCLSLGTIYYIDTRQPTTVAVQYVSVRLPAPFASSQVISARETHPQLVAQTPHRSPKVG